MSVDKLYTIYNRRGVMVEDIIEYRLLERCCIATWAVVQRHVMHTARIDPA